MFFLIWGDFHKNPNNKFSTFQNVFESLKLIDRAQKFYYF